MVPRKVVLNKLCSTKKKQVGTVEGGDARFWGGRGQRIGRRCAGRGGRGNGALGQRVGAALELVRRLVLLAQLLHFAPQKALLPVQLVLVLRVAPVPLLQRLIFANQYNQYTIGSRNWRDTMNTRWFQLAPVRSVTRVICMEVHAWNCPTLIASLTHQRHYCSPESYKDDLQTESRPTEQSWIITGQ